MEQVTLRCARCKTEKPGDEFYKRKCIPRGYTYYCKVCERAYNTARRRVGKGETPEQLRVRAAQWRAANLEHYRSYQAAYHREYLRTHPRK